MVSILIDNASIVTPIEAFDRGAVVIEGGVIQAVGDISDKSLPQIRIDGINCLLVPGFIDLQLNGGFGHDFTADPTTIWSVAQRLPELGVTAFLPTIITSPLQTIEHAKSVLASGPSVKFKGTQPLGLHLEGPFLNPTKKGAHNLEYLHLPNINAIRSWSLDKHIRLVTLAPELPNTSELVDQLVSGGVVVSVGHTNATYEEGLAAFDYGVRYGTHLFNAMSSIHHRRPGISAALLADKRLTIGIIPDGVHVHPAMVKLAWDLCGERLNIVTDGMSALGMPPAQYELGDQKVIVSEKNAQLADGTLAGSILPMNAALRNFIVFTGCSVPEAIQTITTTPTQLLGIAHRKGRIAVGYDADILLLTPDLHVKVAIIGGQIVYQNEARILFTEALK